MGSLLLAVVVRAATYWWEHIARSRFAAFSEAVPAQHSKRTKRNRQKQYQVVDVMQLQNDGFGRRFENNMGRGVPVVEKYWHQREQRRTRC